MTSLVIKECEGDKFLKLTYDTRKAVYIPMNRKNGLLDKRKSWKN